MSREQTTSSLAEKSCAPCSEKTSPLKGDKLNQLKNELHGDWHVVNQHHLEREFSFKDFRQALDFTNRVGEIAEKENHHPDIFLSWGKVRLQLWTHNIGGLSENDFVLAAKVDEQSAS